MAEAARGLGRWPAAGLLLLILGAAGLHDISKARCFSLVGEVTCRVETAAPVVALSFDDGPSAAGTDWAIRQLDVHGVKATFFLVGQEMERRPGLAEALLEAGHEVANHSYSHQRMVARPPGFHRRELAQTQAVLARAGADVRLFRPPYGKKLIGLPLEARRQGLTLVMWDVEDPQARDPAAFADEVVARARPGSIILLHPMYPANGAARQALPRILPGLRGKGLQVVSVSTLLEEARPPGPSR